MQPYDPGQTGDPQSNGDSQSSTEAPFYYHNQYTTPPRGPESQEQSLSQHGNTPQHAGGEPIQNSNLPGNIHPAQLASPFQSPVSNYRAVNKTMAPSQETSGNFGRWPNQSESEYAGAFSTPSGTEQFSNNVNVGDTDSSGVYASTWEMNVLHLNAFNGYDTAAQHVDPDSWQSQQAQPTIDEATTHHFNFGNATAQNGSSTFSPIHAWRSGLPDMFSSYPQAHGAVQDTQDQAQVSYPEFRMNNNDGDEQQAFLSPNARSEMGNMPDSYQLSDSHSRGSQQGSNVPVHEDEEMQQFQTPQIHFDGTFKNWDELEELGERIAPFVKDFEPTESDLEDLERYTRLDEQTGTYIRAIWSTGDLRVLPSDGNDHVIPNNTFEQVSAATLQQYESRLKTMWVKDGGPRRQHIAFPPGYRVYKKSRADGKKSGLFVYGHPSWRRFSALNKFYVHLKWLITTGGVGHGCQCECCKHVTRSQRQHKKQQQQQQEEQEEQDADGELEGDGT